MVKGPLQRREPSKLRNLIKIAEWLGFGVVVLHFLCGVLHFKATFLEWFRSRGSSELIARS